MAVSRGAVLFLFLLLVATEVGTIVDAKMGVAKQILLKDKVKKMEEEEKNRNRKEGNLCLSQSLQFKGFCFDDDKCKEACLKESFPGGECRRDMLKRKCFCKNPC